MATNLEDVALLCLGKEKEHGASLVCCSTDEDHASLWVVQIILQTCKQKWLCDYDQNHNNNFILYRLLLLSAS